MPRRSNPPKYARHSSGQARVRLDGRVHYLGIYGSPESRKKYCKLVSNWLEEREVTHRECPNLTIGTLSLAYMEHAAVYYRKNGEPTSHLHVVRNGLKHLNQRFRDLPAREFGPKRLVALRKELIDQRLSREYVNGLIGVIKRMFRWAVREELVPVSVHQALVTVGIVSEGRSDAREPDPIRPVSHSAIEAIQEHVADSVWGLIQFQRRTGARPGEALIVRGCDLNMSGEVWEFTPAQHKLEHKGISRVVMIGPAGQAILKPFLKTDLQAYLFSPDPDGKRPYRRDSYRNAIVRGCEKAFDMPAHLRYVGRHVARQKDLTDAQRDVLRRKLLKEAAAWRKEHCWHPNQLRHTFATAARRALGIEAARVTLGHSSAVTTEIYAERDLEAARMVLAMIG